MKKTTILFTFILFGVLQNVKAQDVFASTIKLGPFYLGMAQKEVETILLKKFTAKELQASNDNYDKNIKTTLNGIVFNLGFMAQYDEKGEVTKNYQLTRVTCNDSKIKTKSGIAIGTDKLEVFKILDTQKIGYNYNKYFERDEKQKFNGKVNEYIIIYDDQAGKSLQLKLNNGKVVLFSLEYSEGC